MISSTAVSLRLMPTLADITHPAAFSESMNFGGHLKIQPMRYAASSNTSYDRTQKANRAQAVGNSEIKSCLWINDIPPCESYLDSKPSPACGKLPIDDKGEVEKEAYKIYDKVDGDVIYTDIKPGEGPAVTESSQLRVSFHCDTYNKSKKLIGTNGNNSKRREPIVIHFCKDNEHFGEGFKRGMRGMQPGGVRRIISRENGKGLMVFDVELLQVCSSFACWVRDAFQI